MINKEIELRIGENVETIIEAELPISEKSLNMLKEYGFSSFHEMFFSEEKNIELLQYGKFYVDILNQAKLNNKFMVPDICISFEDSVGRIKEVNENSIVILFFDDKEKQDFVINKLNEDKVSVVVRAIAETDKTGFKLIAVSLKIEE